MNPSIAFHRLPTSASRTSKYFQILFITDIQQVLTKEKNLKFCRNGPRRDDDDDDSDGIASPFCTLCEKFGTKELNSALTKFVVDDTPFDAKTILYEAAIFDAAIELDDIYFWSHRDPALLPHLFLTEDGGAEHDDAVSDGANGRLI